MPVPYYSDNDLLGENDLNKIKNNINTKMRELYSILDSSQTNTYNEAIIQDTSSGKIDILVNEIIILIVKNGSMLLESSSFIIPKVLLNDAEIKKINDNIINIKKKWDNWFQNRPDAALLTRLTLLNDALSDIQTIEEQEEMVVINNQRLKDIEDKIQNTQIQPVDDIKKEIIKLENEIKAFTVTLTPDEEKQIISEHINSDPAITDAFNQRDNEIQQFKTYEPYYKYLSSNIPHIKPLQDEILKLQTDIPILDTELQTKTDDISLEEQTYKSNIDNNVINKDTKTKLKNDLKAVDLQLKGNPSDATLIDKKKELEESIKNIETSIFSDAQLNQQKALIELHTSNLKKIEKDITDSNKLLINKEKELKDLLIHLVEQSLKFNPTTLPSDLSSIAENDLISYTTDSLKLLTDKEQELKDSDIYIQNIITNYLDDYKKDLGRKNEELKNENIIKLQEDIDILNNTLGIKQLQSDYNHYKPLFDKFEQELQIQKTQTLNNINTTLGSSDPNILRQEALKIENDTNITFQTEYKAFIDDTDIEKQKLNVNTSIANTISVKINNSSFIDFDKNITKIIFNFKIINDEFKTIITNFSNISLLKYDQLIKTYDRFKISCLLIKQKIKELPSGNLTLENVKGKDLSEFTPVKDNVKLLFNLLNEFDNQINQLKNKYNPTRAVPKVNIGGSIFNKYYKNF